MHEPAVEHPTHGLAHVNAVMATLALLTESCSTGIVRNDILFRVDADVERAALLEAVTAIQTEVSLSIFASDPLIADAVHGFESIDETAREDLVIETDHIVQEWLGLLAGRGQELTELGDWIQSRGEVSLTEIAERLQV